MLTRNKEVLLWLTEEELADLKANTKKCGLTVQSYLRQLLSGIRPKELPPADYFSILQVLHRIGINLRSIAYKANTLGFVDSASYWDNVFWLQSTIGELREMMSQLQEQAPPRTTRNPDSKN